MGIILLQNKYRMTLLPATLFPWFETLDITFDCKIFYNVISDRWSKYTLSWGRVTDKEQIKPWLKTHLEDKYFRKATHNTYAYRIVTPEWGILEGKNDDGETGAGQCILRELQRKNLTNGIVVVTRYFGWTKLYWDRFRHVVDGTKIFLEKIEKGELGDNEK